MPQNPLTVHSAEAVRKSGTLSLFLLEDELHTVSDAQVPAAVVGPLFARFRLSRGFLDDENHILPIRLRIQLEGELAHGRKHGQVEGPLLRFHWEFLES